MTRDLIDDLIHAKTEIFQSNLYDCIKFGLNDHDDELGLRAADADCYSVYAKLFDPIISDFHQLAEAFTEHPPTDWGDVDTLNNPDADGNFVEKTAIFVSRSLEGFPFPNKMNESQFRDAMNSIRSALDLLHDTEISGDFHAFEAMDIDTKSRLIGENVMFDSDGQSAHNCSGFWPTGRAVYVSEDKVFSAQINSKDHLRFGCAQSDGNIKSLYGRLAAAGKILDEKLSLIRDSKYGWLTQSPERLGSTLDISMHLKLAKLPKDADKLGEVMAMTGLRIICHSRGEDEAACVEVKNRKCLGLTELEAVQDFISGVESILKAESELG